MGLHTETSIYKAAYDLFDVVMDLARNMPRDHKAQLGDMVLMHDPRQDVIMQAPPALMALVPPHKRLLNQPTHRGLPIGNLSSQFFANVYLDVLDQHAKHVLGARHYIRYVDDFLLLHESPQWLKAAHDDIEAFLPRRLGARLNPTKTILQPVSRGIDFVGQVIRPWVRTTRRRTVNVGAQRLSQIEAHEVHAAANSYLGLLRQATGSHADRARLTKIIRYRGHAVDFGLTKAYRRSTAMAAEAAK